MWRVKANAEPWLNVRAGRGTNFTKVGQFTPSQVIDVTAVVDGWATVAMHPPHVALYVSAQYVEQLVVEDDPHPVVATAMLGMHLMPNLDQARTLNFLADAYRNGTPVPCVLLGIVPSMSNVSAQDIKAVSPSTVIIARYYTGRNYSRDWASATEQDGYAYFNSMKHHISDDVKKYASYVIPMNVNEPGDAFGSEAGHNRWWHGMLTAANEFGVNLAMFTWATGNPKDIEYWKRTDTHDLLRRAKREGHCVAIHEYGYRGDFTDVWHPQRHDLIYERLPDDLQDITIYVTETGESFETNKPEPTTPEHFLAYVWAQHRSFAKRKNLKGMIWSWGDSGGWARDRVDDLEPQYMIYLRATKAL